MISYFTVKYGEFTYAQVEEELEEIFREQYSLSLSGERSLSLKRKPCVWGNLWGRW